MFTYVNYGLYYLFCLKFSLHVQFTVQFMIQHLLCLPFFNQYYYCFVNLCLNTVVLSHVIFQNILNLELHIACLLIVLLFEFRHNITQIGIESVYFGKPAFTDCKILSYTENMLLQSVKKHDHEHKSVNSLKTYLIVI